MMLYASTTTTSSTIRAAATFPTACCCRIGVDGLLAAGKSAVRRGPQIRQRHTVQLMGQVAGVAAALAVKHGVQPRDVDVAELQRNTARFGP